MRLFIWQLFSGEKKGHLEANDASKKQVIAQKSGAKIASLAPRHFFTALTRDTPL